MGNEPVAIANHTWQCKKCAPDFVVKSSGLVLNATWPWLAASPDAVAHDPQAGGGVVEVKCPFVCWNQSLSDAVESSSVSFLEQCPDGFRLEKVHAYFYQVQFQLLVTGSQ